MKIMKVIITEMLKRICIRLMSLVLIAIPLFACYPLLILLGFSERISTVTTIVLSVVAYFSMIRWVEPFLRRTVALSMVPLILLGIVFLLRLFPFRLSDVQERLEKNRDKRLEYKRVIS